MGIFDFFKNKGKDTQKELTLEDCIIKMFASADIEPHREGDEFSFKVQGKYCVFNVTLSYEANRIWSTPSRCMVQSLHLGLLMEDNCMVQHFSSYINF